MTTRVLVVDDEPKLARAWAKALGHDGLYAKTAGSLDEARAACEKESFDVLVVDYLIPGTNGVEVIAALRERLPHARAILVSGQLDPDASAAEIVASIREQVEVDAYLHKPVPEGALAALIAELVARVDGEDWAKWAAVQVAARKRLKKTVKEAAATVSKLKKKKRGS